MFIFKVTKCILCNYHVHCSKKEPLPFVTWILVISSFIFFEVYGDIKTFVKAESHLLHNTEPQIAPQWLLSQPQRSALERHLSGSEG